MFFSSHISSEDVTLCPSDCRLQASLCRLSVTAWPRITADCRQWREYSVKYDLKMFLVIKEILPENNRHAILLFHKSFIGELTSLSRSEAKHLGNNVVQLSVVISFWNLVKGQLYVLQYCTIGNWSNNDTLHKIQRNSNSKNCFVGTEK